MNSVFKNNMQPCAALSRSLFVLFALATFSVSASAQEAIRSSANVVGFIKTMVRKQGLYQLACPFEAMPAGNVAATQSMFQELPNGTSIVAWDKDAQAYSRVTVKALGGWFPDSYSVFGKSFWLRVGNSASQEHLRVILCGQVPAAASTVVPLANSSGPDGKDNLNLLGYAYPCAIEWSKTGLAANAGNGSAVSVYDSEHDVFHAYTRNASGWSGDFTLAAGQAFWLRAVQCESWEEPRPYDWP